MTLSQKHAFLYVPNYDGRDPAAKQRPNSPLSYLVLGSTTEDLGVAASILDGTGSSWPGGDLLSAAGVPDACASGGNGFFMDDSAANNDLAQGGSGIDRNQSAAGTSYFKYTGNGVKASGSPVALSNELRTRGGYRDHTDGNRISTTRGDRVDWIQGNYMRVIFGRATNSGTDSQGQGWIGSSTWESSGGHNHDSTSTPGMVTTITWHNSASGGETQPSNFASTWKVISETLNGNEITRFSGKVQDYFHGPLKRSVIGAWSHNDDPGYPLSTGSYGGDDHPEIDEKTDADEMESTTTVHRYARDRTTAGDEIKSESFPNHARDDTGTAGNKVDNLISHYAAKTLKFEDYYVVKADATFGGNATANFGNAFKFSLSGLAIGIRVGVTFDLMLGNFTFGATVAGATDCYIGLEMSTMIGGEIVVNLKKKQVKINDNEIKGATVDVIKQSARILLLGDEKSAQKYFM